MVENSENLIYNKKNPICGMWSYHIQKEEVDMEFEKLVSPSLKDLFISHIEAMILSVPEGHDKPLKYPLIFTVCDVLLINKIDVLPYFDFDMEEVTAYAKTRNPNIQTLPICAKTGEGIDAWADWPRHQVRDWQS